MLIGEAADVALVSNWVADQASYPIGKYGKCKICHMVLVTAEKHCVLAAVLNHSVRRLTCSRALAREMSRGMMCFLLLSLMEFPASSTNSAIKYSKGSHKHALCKICDACSASWALCMLDNGLQQRSAAYTARNAWNNTCRIICLPVSASAAS